MKNFTLLTIFLLLQVSILVAQDNAETVILSETVVLEVAEVDTVIVENTSIQFGGSIDAYYRVNFNNDFDASPASSFANLPGFALGFANLTVSKDGAKAGFMADLVFGPRGEDATFASGALRPVVPGVTTNSSGIVNQLYAYWNISDNFKVTLGNFNTFLGYEVISPTGNFNYSTTYAFSFGPFSHTGLKIDTDLGNGFSLMAGVFNPTDFTEFNLTNDYVGGLQLGYDFGNGSVYLNGLFQDGFYQVDITGGVDVTDKVYLGLNATVAEDNFGAIGIYAQAELVENFKLGIRGEYFADNGIGVVGDDENVFDFTISANYTVGNLTIIPELRIDAVSTDVFPDDGGLNDTLTSFLLAAVYAF